MIVRLTGFQGVIPSIDPTMIPDSAAQAAQNCKLGSGSVKPLQVALSVATPSKTGTKTTIWRYDDYDSNGTPTPYWMHWCRVNSVDVDVNAVRSPLPDDSYKRMYWTGDGVPKMAPLTSAVPSGGSTDYPVGSYHLGVPTPSSAPSAAYAGTATLGSDVTKYETRDYRIRFVSAYGEVGPPSPASSIVTVDPTAADHSVTITPLGSLPDVSEHNIAYVDIFRANTGTNATDYQHLVRLTLANATSAYTDTTANAALGYVLDSAEYLKPNDSMTGLIALPNGALAGFYNNVLCISEPYLPHAWPASNQYSLADRIVSLGAFGNSLLVTTVGAPYVVTGSVPAQMNVERFEEGYSCISKRGTVDMGYSIIYPTPLGLYQVGVNGAKLITAATVLLDEWKALQMETAKAYAYAGKYLAFTAAGTFCFDPADGTYVTLTTAVTGGNAVTAGFSDMSTGKLYLMSGSAIVQFDGGVTAGTYTWKSKKFTAPSPLNMAALQVTGSGSAVVKVYGDGNLLYTTPAFDTSNPLYRTVRLPSGSRASYFEVEITAACAVSQVLMATSMSELAQV